ncbi:hypothetical protein HAX54_049308, partial [Datura stramonium]|nr:hypothetical protein [Datura stramonium]
NTGGGEGNHNYRDNYNPSKRNHTNFSCGGNKNQNWHRQQRHENFQQSQGNQTHNQPRSVEELLKNDWRSRIR